MLNRRKRNELIEKISPCVFWDADISKLDADKNKDYIIERVMTRGFEKDEYLLWKIYSLRTLKKIVVKLEGLNDFTVGYLSEILNIREKKFKCYGKVPSYLNY
ncbi:MAG: hypothetical protein LBH43_08500 [Treponema sp.]|jgi:hypothetical protein|nr:hypothetical protein [Treponema sp.]